MLKVEDLIVSVAHTEPPVDIVRGVSLEIGRGEILGVVGESGCGKSMTALAIMGLLPKPAIGLRSGRIMLDDADITELAPYRRVEEGCGGVAMIFQEPMTSLNPVMRIGDQIEEALRVHDRGAGRSADARARELLDLVRIPDAALQLHAYPHELSGGMRQRVVIAIALACNPQVLVADEPTTALDVTVQAQILNLIRDLCDELAMGVLFISHDLGVISQLADRVSVMYAGRVVERASVSELFAEPMHPYTRGLFDCLPDPAKRSGRLSPIGGQAPNMSDVPAGCAFAPRCKVATSDCTIAEVSVTRLPSGHMVECNHPQFAPAEDMAP